MSAGWGGAGQFGEPGDDPLDHLFFAKAAVAEEGYGLGDLHGPFGGQVTGIQLKAGGGRRVRGRGGGEQDQVGVGQPRRPVRRGHGPQHLLDLGHAGQRVPGG